MDEYDIPKPVPPRPSSFPPPAYPGQPGQPGWAGQPGWIGPGYAQPTAQWGSGQPVVARGPERGAGRVNVGSRTRATIGAFLTTLGCLAGSLAVAAFVLATIALNPARPGAIVKAALSTPAGRSVVSDAVTTALRSSDPALSPKQASVDAAAIVASPALASSLGSSKVDVSSALLAELKQVDPAAATAVSAHLPAGATGPRTLSALPSGALSAASRAHSALHTAEDYLLIVAVLAVGAALLIGPRRARILVRVGCWALAASVVQLAIWLGLPRALAHFSNPWAQVAAAALRAGGTGLLRVFVTLAVSGVVLIVIGLAGRFMTGLARTARTA
jgi:hypothetical protein